MAVVDALTLGLHVLHGGVPHTVEASSHAGFQWWQVAASILLVGSVGGALYWYYGRQIEAR